MNDEVADSVADAIKRLMLAGERVYTPAEFLPVSDVRDAVGAICRRILARKEAFTENAPRELASAARTLSRLGDPAGVEMFTLLGLDPSCKALAELWPALAGFIPSKDNEVAL